MTNKEVLERGIPHEIEETLFHLLSDFWEQIKEYKLDNCSQPPVNPVTAYKNFLKRESIVDTTIYDKYHPIHEADIIDAEYKEVETSALSEHAISKFASELKTYIRDGIIFQESLEVVIEELVKKYEDNFSVIVFARELRRNINKEQISGAAFKQLIDKLCQKYVEPEKHRSEASLFGITEGIICQQVNCCGVMGAGLAREIAGQFPQVKEAFDAYYNRTINDRNKDYQCHFNQLGTQMLIPLDGLKVTDSKLLIANIYSQDFYGNAAITGKVYTKLPRLINSIREIAANDPGKPVYIPYAKGLDGKRDCGIGCGYGGESWDRVYSELQTLSEQYGNLYLLDIKTNEVTKIEPLQITEEKGDEVYEAEYGL